MSKKLCKFCSNKYKINDKGIFNFDFILGTLIVIMVIAIVLDTFMLNPKLSALSNASNYVLTTVSRQGNIGTINPSGMKPEDFVKNKVIIENATTILANAGFDTSTIKIYVNGTRLTESATKTYQYGSTIIVTLVATSPYRYNNAINPDINHTVTTRKSGVSTYYTRTL